MEHKSINFTAYNVNTGKRESFSCLYSELAHKDHEDAATSKLWYGASWSRHQMENADVQVQADRNSVADEAWFIVRTAGTLAGIRAAQVEPYLKRSTPGRIESDAEQIQHDHAMPSANAVQKAVVGNLIRDLDPRAVGSNFRL